MQTVEALQNNKLANESDLFIYSDAPKNEGAETKVKEVREFIKQIDGFKNVTIIEREKNWGLADSIIDGVTNIVNKYGKIIVLEDDLVTSPYFLKFMNEALEYYKNEKKVWHISGWNYPINTDGLGDVFFWRMMNCWGWGTWPDRWRFFQKDADKLLFDFTNDQIVRFNLDGVKDFWSQVKSNKDGKINTWAIFWYATIFKQNGLCLNPAQTFVANIGLDSSGTHCGKNNSYDASLSLSKKIKFINTLDENEFFLIKIKKFFRAQKKSVLIRLANKLSRMITGKNFSR
jgi:hypothetical protein